MKLLLILMCMASVKAFIFDPELSMDYHTHGPKPQGLEELTIQVSPLPRSKVKKPLLKIPIRVSWNPVEKTTPATISQLVKNSWRSSFGDGHSLDDRQLLKLSDGQLMTLIYRNKHYNNGVVKISYIAKAKGEPVNLYFDMPPITPGELECRFVHEDMLRLKLEKLREKLEMAKQYLKKAGCAERNFEVPAVSDKETIDTLKSHIMESESHLESLGAAMAQRHVELAYELHRLSFSGLSCEDSIHLASMKAQLPEIPINILPIETLLEINTFINSIS